MTEEIKTSTGELSADPVLAKTAPPSPPLTPATLAHKIGDLILEKKGTELVVVEIDEVSSLADYLVIASAANRRQVQAIAQEAATFAKAGGVSRHVLEGMEQGWWVLLDLGDVIVHIMQSDARRFYDLEMLWADGHVVRRTA